MAFSLPLPLSLLKLPIDVVNRKHKEALGKATATAKTTRTPQNNRFNPLRPNNDLSQTSHCNIKGVSVIEVMRIENKITPVKFY